MTTTQFRLGRIPQFDEKSRGFPLPVAASLPTKVSHRLYGTPLDQGQTNSCTGHAMAHALNTEPIHKPRARLATHDTALRLYSRATQLDSFPGEWDYPCPVGKQADANGGYGDDNGSSGLAACKAAKETGRIAGYEWAFGFDHALQAMPDGPIMIGIDWTEDMFQPDAKGVVHPTGQVAGGHEICWVGYDQTTGLARIANSWGTSWGVSGFFYIPLTELRPLIDNGGDCTRPKVTA